MRKYDVAKANPRHIPVRSEQQCNNLKQQIIDNPDFAAIASAHAKCLLGKLRVR
jgi:peptidyl-prolyl cis-trans isomerase C